MTLKAVILVAGRGRRMGRLTKDIPKCLLPIMGKPLLFHQIDRLLEIGVKEITVVVGYKAEHVRSRITDTSEYSFVKCLFNPFYSLTESIVSLWIYLLCSSRISEVSRTIILSGDRIIDANVYYNLRDCFVSTIAVLGPRDYITVPKDSIILSGDDVVAIGKKSPYIYGGIMNISDRDILPLLASIESMLHNREGFQKWYLEGISEMIKRGRKIKTLIFPMDFCVNLNRSKDLNNPLVRRFLGEKKDE